MNSWADNWPGTCQTRFDLACLFSPLERYTAGEPAANQNVLVASLGHSSNLRGHCGNVLRMTGSGAV